MRVLLVEPYSGGSHRAWAEGFQQSSANDVQIVSLPARWWKWRMRGGFVTLAERCRKLAVEGYVPDVLLVTDMLDVAGFRGLLPAGWRSVPVVAYFHESQLTYPDSPQMEPDLSYAFTNWTSAVAANRLVFNSEYHRSVFFGELPRLLRHFPDHRHEHLVPEVEAKSSVVPVGVDLSWVNPSDHDGPPLVMWNHRWEHDKDPGAFATALAALSEEGIEFVVALCGERFANDDGAFAGLADRLGDRVVQYGHAPLDRYRHLLNRSDVVVSTAHQEFFGVAVVEAMAAGAAPVLPARLSYPELIPLSIRRHVLYSEGGLTESIRRVLADPGLRDAMSAVTASHSQRFALEQVSPMLDSTLDSALRT